jgi:hypothetical protein
MTMVWNHDVRMFPRHCPLFGADIMPTMFLRMALSSDKKQGGAGNANPFGPTNKD